jgi:hypothetical protein
VPKVKINISLHFSYLMTSNGRTTWPLVDCCTSNRRGQVDLQFDIQQSTNGALQSFHTAHSGTYWHIMPNSGTIRFLTGTHEKVEGISEKKFLFIMTRSQTLENGLITSRYIRLRLLKILSQFVAGVCGLSPAVKLPSIQKSFGELLQKVCHVEII